MMFLSQEDDEMHPEYYRKGGYVKGSNEDIPEPFRVGRILEISCRKKMVCDPEIRLRVQKFYR